MRVLAGNDAPIVIIQTKKDKNYTNARKFIGEVIVSDNHQKEELANFFLENGGILVASTAGEPSSTQVLAAYKLHNSFVMDNEDIIEGISAIEIELSNTEKIGSTFVLWLHRNKLQESEGEIIFSLQGKDILFNTLSYNGCYVSWELLIITKEANGWRFQLGTKKSLSNKAGIERSYGVFKRN